MLLSYCSRCFFIEIEGILSAFKKLPQVCSVYNVYILVQYLSHYHPQNPQKPIESRKNRQRRLPVAKVLMQFVELSVHAPPNVLEKLLTCFKECMRTLSEHISFSGQSYVR